MAKYPRTAWDSGVFAVPSGMKTRMKWDRLLIATASLGRDVGSGAVPRNAAMLVPTPSMERAPPGTSST